jgi:TolA-binding protein
MKTSRLLVSGLLLAGLLQSPRMLSAQNKDIISIQRDIGQLEKKLGELKTAETERMDSLDAQLKQVLDSSAKLNAAVAALQKNLSDTVGAVSSLNEQQGKQLLAPMATVSTRVDQMATEFSELKQSVNALGQQLSRFDTRLNDLNNTMRTLSTPTPAPPAQAGTPANTAAPPPSASNGAPPGFSASATFENAQRDYYSGKDETAIEEFRTFLMYAANSENGPKAYYYMGQIYYRGGQYEDAVKAFDAVLERYQANPSSPDAMLMKAQSLMKAGHHAEAIVEFRTFLEKYPSDPNRARAEVYLKELTAPAKANPPHNNQKKGR